MTAHRLDRPLSQVLRGAPPDWAPIIQAWSQRADGAGLIARLDALRLAGACLYPPDPLRALRLTPRATVRVVILGQDPYHGPGQAEGLAFSVPPGYKVPPSLRNIDAELARDLGLPAPAHGHLGAWARQGVLLLNTVLTVEAGCPGAHARLGWEGLTDDLIAAVARDPGEKAFLLWGAQAQTKRGLIEATAPGRHLLLTANHPSPLSARRPPQPFVGCGHFCRATDFIARHHPASLPLDWRR